MKTVFGKLMKSEYRLWFDNILMLNILSSDSSTMIITENTCVLRKCMLNYLVIRKEKISVYPHLLCLTALFMTTLLVESKLPLWA